MTFNFPEILSLFASVHGIVLAVLMCFSKKFKAHGKLFLGMVILIISVLVLRDLFEKRAVIQQFQILYINTWGLPILLGPLLYLYIKTTIAKEYRLRNWGKHFGVPVLYFIFLNYALLKGIASEEVAQDYPILFGVYIFFQVFIVLQLPVYLAVSIRLVLGFKKGLREEFSNIDQINVNWLIYLLLAFSLLYIFWAALFSGDIAILEQILTVGSINYVTLSMAVLIYSIGYWSLLHPEVFQVALQRHKKQPQPTIDQSEIEVLKKKISDVLEKKKIHLNPKLTVKELAIEIETSPKAMSQIIKAAFNMTFYELINSFRIEEVKRNLVDKDNSHLTIEGIALNSGFNSSSTFNRLFKANTGITPRAFRSSFGKAKSDA